MKVVLCHSGAIRQFSRRTMRRLVPQLVSVIVVCLTISPGQARTASAQGTQPPGASASVTDSYTIDDLGEYRMIAADVTVPLSSDGAVAYWTRKDESVRAMLWRSGQATTIEDVPGYPNTIPHAINRQGDIAGWMNTSRNPVDSLSTTRGFVRHAGRIEIVPGLGGRDNRVFGLNDKGTAVGSAGLADGTSYAFLFSDSRSYDLGTLPLGKSSTAYAINNAGLIAGAADVNGRFNHAVLWTNRKILDLGTLPHGATSSARAINDRGEVVGFGETPEGVHAFLYTQGTMRDLGTLGDDPSEASGINNRGEVVGASNLTNSTRHAFLWREGRMADLNSFLPKGTPWLLLNAFSINDRGQIVCSGRRKGESTHLLLLTPVAR
jgi:probable HAF family extracellular repeat protein